MSEFQQTMSGLMTGALLILFIGICIWSWSSKRKESFDRMAHLPLDDSPIKDRDNNSNTAARADKEKREASL